MSENDFVVLSIPEWNQLRKDAERYRFLRTEKSQGNVDVLIELVEWDRYPVFPGEGLYDEEADRVIDYLMSQPKGSIRSVDAIP